MNIIAVANQKGGVGKTTTTLNLGAALAEKGQRVLLIDLDPQFSLTRGFGIDPTDGPGTVSEALLKRRPLAEIVRPATTKIPNLFIVASFLTLAQADMALLSMTGSDTRLRQAMKGIKGFDYTLIDCPPALGKLTVNALAAADKVLVPVDCSPWALAGMDQLNALIEDTKLDNNPHLELWGIVLTFFQKNTALSTQVRNTIKSEWPGKLFDSSVRLTVKLKETTLASEPIITYDSSSAAAEDYRALANEVIQRRDSK
jgi:chromosome partitioning protein